MSNNSNNTSHTIKGEVKKNVELEIIKETYKEGDMMPSLVKLQSLYSCGRNTARMVLNELCGEDIISLQKNVGYFLKPFAKEKLLKKFYQEIELEVEKCVEEAYNIQMDSKVLEELIREKIKTIYSR